MRDIKPTARKWVVVSKTLHHLLPDLVVPMDNLMTAPFLGMSALPATFDGSFLEVAYSAFTDLAGTERAASGFGISERRPALFPIRLREPRGPTAGSGMLALSTSRSRIRAAARPVVAAPAVRRGAQKIAARCSPFPIATGRTPA